MSELVDLKEFLSGFLAEAEEHLSLANSNVLSVDQSLAKGESNPRAVRELFRSLHTIKGLAAMVGIEPIVDVSHAMETALRSADTAGGRLSKVALELIVKGLGEIDERVRGLSLNVAPKAAPKALLDAFAALEEHTVSSPEETSPFPVEPSIWSKFSAAEKEQFSLALRDGQRVLRVDFVPSPERTDELNITSVRERLAKLADIVRVLPLSVPASEAAPGGLLFALFVTTTASDDVVGDAVGGNADSVVLLSGGAPMSMPPPSMVPEEDSDLGAAPRGTFVRVPVSRLDDSLENLSALVVTRFKLLRAVGDLSERGADVRYLTQIVSENGRQLRDLRASIMRMRMVSVRSLLERVPLLVRGLSRSTGKIVALTLETGETELDKAVAERVFPAIVHLVRNAVDHGIESSAERRSAGKNEEGKLRIACFQRSNSQLEIRIEDDGQGIDAKVVAERAELPVPRNDSELLEMITRPGVSTAARITTTSGRGLGMDIVKRVVVSDLGGELSVETRRGMGTAFTLRIPLTITIIDAFSFLCGGERFVTPVGSIEEIIEVEPDRVVQTPRARAGGSETRLIERRGQALPLFALDAVFGLPPNASSQQTTKALIVRRHAQSFAFEVGRMLGQQEVVVRPLEDPLVRVTGVSGSTDLGDGKPTLVLDLLALSSTLSRTEELYS